MDLIDFYFFFVAVKKDISKNHLLAINPYSQKYYKINSTYLVLRTINQNLYVDYAITIGRQAFERHWLDVLISEAKKNSYLKMLWETEENNKIVQSASRKIGAKEISRTDGFIKYELELI